VKARKRPKARKAKDLPVAAGKTLHVKGGRTRTVALTPATPPGVPIPYPN
jgi:hypothetical protein